MQARIGELEDFYQNNGHNEKIHFIQSLILKLKKTLLMRTHAEEGEHKNDYNEISGLNSISRIDISRSEMPILSQKEEKLYFLNFEIIFQYRLAKAIYELALEELKKQNSTPKKSQRQNEILGSGNKQSPASGNFAKVKLTEKEYQLYLQKKKALLRKKA